MLSPNCHRRRERTMFGSGCNWFSIRGYVDGVKAGRGRKVPAHYIIYCESAAPVVLLPLRLCMYLAQQQQAPGKMGVVLLFTFLNPSTSPTSNSTPSGSALTNHAHKHVGTVLTALNSTLFSHTAYITPRASTVLFRLPCRHHPNSLHSASSRMTLSKIFCSIHMVQSPIA
jgi:hypothetical protein